MASRRAAQRGTLLLTLQTSQPFLARSELVNKDLDAALSKNYPGSSALSRVTPGLLLVLCVYAGFRRHHIQFPHSCLGPRMALPLGAEPAGVGAAPGANPVPTVTFHMSPMLRWPPAAARTKPSVPAHLQRPILVTT